MHSVAVFNLFITDDVVCLSVCYTCDENRVHQFRVNVFRVIRMTHHQIHLRLSIRPLAPHLRRSLAVSCGRKAQCCVSGRYKASISISRESAFHRTKFKSIIVDREAMYSKAQGAIVSEKECLDVFTNSTSEKDSTK